MSGDTGRPAPAVLGAHGVFVPAECSAELSSALTLYFDLLSGKVPPGSCRLPRPTRTLVALQEAAAAAASEHQAARHRVLAQSVAVPGNYRSVPLVPVAETGSSSTPATMTVQQAADYLKRTPRRIRQLAASGRIAGTLGERNVWHLNADSVAAQRTRQRRRHGSESGTAAGPGPFREAGEGAAGSA